MYEVEYLYEQLKTQTVEQQYINVLDSISESAYDTLTPQENINETMELIDEAVKKIRFNFFDKLKAAFSSIEKILEKYKDAALKCRPIGLEYKGFKTFMSDADIQKRYKATLAYINKFNPATASESELKQYILDSNHNVQYTELSKIFGNGETTYSLSDIAITNKSDKDITKQDIADAVKYLQNYKSNFEKHQKEAQKSQKEYQDYVNANGFATGATNKSVEELRKNAMNHKRAFIAISESSYYALLEAKAKQELEQNKRIVIKAANYNPRNLKESAVIQNYIDIMRDFYID